MKDIFEAVSFLLLEFVGGLGVYCLWLNFNLPENADDEQPDNLYRKLGFRNLSIKLLSTAILGTALMYGFNRLTGVEIICLGFGAIYFAMALLDFFFWENNVLAGLKLIVPIALFFNAYHPDIWFILIALLVIVYDVQRKRADGNVNLTNKKNYEESDKK